MESTGQEDDNDRKSQLCEARSAVIHPGNFIRLNEKPRVCPDNWLLACVQLFGALRMSVKGCVYSGKGWRRGGV